MKIVVAGSSGLIGSALVKAVRGDGNEVVRLVRRAPHAVDEIQWNPAKRELDVSALGEIDAVVNLAGENIAAGRWTAGRREKILRSRVDATQTLVAACLRLPRKPQVFVNASAIGFYGDRGDEELTEASGAGLGFLPETCLIWETNAEGAARAGIRTVLLRLGVVLARDGGALAKLRPVFRLGLGGRLGDGRQWMSWVSLTDAVRAVQYALADARCAGAVNVVAPEPVTNADFTTTLAHVLDRPAAFHAPAWVLRLALGAMATETLLASTRVRPERLLGTGFAFRHPTLAEALRAELGG